MAIKNNQSGFSIFLVLLTLVFLPLLAVLAFFVPPSLLIFPQWLGLVMSLLVAGNIVLVVYLMTRQRRINYYLLLFFFLGCGYYFPLMLQWNPFRKADNIDLKIASYNVRNMRSEYGLSTMHNIIDFAHANELDVLFLQEVPNDVSTDELLESFTEMKAIVVSEDENHPGSRLAILSKFPLSFEETKTFENRTHYALFAVMNLNGEEMMLVNCHLQTTNWNQIKHHRQPLFFEGSYQTISKNYENRGYQTQAIREKMNKVNMPLIVAGDFNDPPVSFSYRTIGSNLTDAFRESGNGYGYTYRFLKKLFRIDYVFYDGNRFEGYNYRTEKLNYSDHLPVLVDLVLKK